MTVATLAPDQLGPTVCVGEILVEIVATTVGDGFLSAQPLIGPYPSGAPAIFIDQCGKMGASAAMVGAVGDDDFGRVNLDRLREDGVDISAIAIDTNFPTGSAFVRYRANGSRDFVFNIAKSAAARFGWTDAVAALIGRSGHLHVMGSALSMPSACDVIDRAVDIIKGRGGTLSVDPNIRKELKLDAATEQRFSGLVARADLLLPSGEELERAAGVDGETHAIRRLFEWASGRSFSSGAQRVRPAFRGTEPAMMVLPLTLRKSTRLVRAIVLAELTWPADVLASASAKA